MREKDIMRIKDAETKRLQLENLQKLLPAFRGIEVDGVTDLADMLSSVFSDHNASSVSISQEIFSKIADRIRRLSMERTGATWVNAEL